jgi:class 3 adenylate cyclase
MTSRQSPIPSRRAVLAGIATAPALAAPALANHTGDVRLRELWAQYLEYLAAELAAHAATESARAAYDAEEPPCPPDVRIADHLRAQRPLWEKHDLDRLYNIWNEAGELTDATVKAILEQEAEGLFGVGAKIAALPTQDGQDPAFEHERAMRSALSNIDRLIGTTFLAAFALVSKTSADDDLYEDDDDDGEDEAVS